MNIVIFIHSLNFGGAERVAAHMASYWAQAGHITTVLTIAPMDKNQYKLPKEVRIRSINHEIKSTGIISAAQNNLVRIWKIRNSIKELDADVVVSMMTPANVMLGIASIGLPAWTVGSERIHPESHKINRLWYSFRKYCYFLLDTIVTQTTETETWIRENTNAKLTLVIPNPIVMPVPSQNPIIKPPIESNKKLIVGVGRLTPQKQFDHLIKAFSTIQNQYSHWNIAILGEGEDHHALNELIIESQLSDRIQLVGRVGNIADWLNVADLFVMTSSAEGFPNALIEAMAHQTAVISYNCPTGPAEIIEHGFNGLLVETNNIEELTSALNKIMSSPTLGSLLAENALKIKDRLELNKIMKVWNQAIGL